MCIRTIKLPPIYKLSSSSRACCYAYGCCLLVVLEMAIVLCSIHSNNNSISNSSLISDIKLQNVYGEREIKSASNDTPTTATKYGAFANFIGSDSKMFNENDSINEKLAKDQHDHFRTDELWLNASSKDAENVEQQPVESGQEIDILRVSNLPVATHKSDTSIRGKQATALIQLKNDYGQFNAPQNNTFAKRKGPRSIELRVRERQVTNDADVDDYNRENAIRLDDNDNYENYRSNNHELIKTAESAQQKFDDCALILKRTYILNNNDKGVDGSESDDEWGEKYVFNDSDEEGEKVKVNDKKKGKKKMKQKNDKLVHKTDLCIKHSDVDKAIGEAKHKLKFKASDDVDQLDISTESVGKMGEVNLLASALLMKQFDMSHDEILNALPMIDMSGPQFNRDDSCPKHVRPMFCMKSRYRTLTGHCNNLRHPAWGAAKTPYSRYLPPDYADGLGEPRASRIDNRPLPSARLISSIIHVDSDEPSHDYSILFADWGQLLNHDVTRVAVGSAPDCCPQYLNGLCMPIPVPASDPLYSKFKVKCLKFDRALPAIRQKCLLGPRSPFNQVTSPIDASFVYGSSKQQAASLRTFSGGKLKSWNYFDRLKLKPLLPPKVEKPDEECLGRPKNLFCFEAGDVRVNEQTHLTVLHTVYMREHNRLAKTLGEINLDWDDEKIYHETRHIIAACVQHVMINEFLPLLLGPKIMAQYELGPRNANSKHNNHDNNNNGADYWQGYDPSVTISTGAGFAGAAFRYGHSMVEGKIKRFDTKTGSLVASELLRFLLKRPFILYEPGAIDQLIMGMILTPSEQTDPFMSEELSGHLFQPPKAKFGHDLAAINIQRGRDTGIPGYNDWREWCGLGRAKSFDDLEPLLMNHTAWQYERIYKHVDDIDLWSAGVSERKLPGSAVGPTFACIIARQFLNFKRGDRFWYENPNQPSSFTVKQLREIKKVKLAKILCANSDDIAMIQPWAMRLPHPIYNARVSCDSLPSINLKYWDSSNIDLGFR